MSRIRIYVFATKPHPDLSFAGWTGDVDWPGAPEPGSTWFHCSDWAGETVNRVAFYAPVADGEPGLTLEVKTDPETIRHLLAEHGFTE